MRATQASRVGDQSNYEALVCFLSVFISPSRKRNAVRSIKPSGFAVLPSSKKPLSKCLNFEWKIGNCPQFLITWATPMLWYIYGQIVLMNLVCQFRLPCID